MGQGGVANHLARAANFVAVANVPPPVSDAPNVTAKMGRGFHTHTHTHTSCTNIISGAKNQQQINEMTAKVGGKASRLQLLHLSLAVARLLLAKTWLWNSNSVAQLSKPLYP